MSDNNDDDLIITSLDELDDDELEIYIELDPKCFHGLRIYKESSLPVGEWTCVDCGLIDVDEVLNAIHTADDIKQLINEGNEI